MVYSFLGAAGVASAAGAAAAAVAGAAGAGAAGAAPSMLNFCRRAWRAGTMPVRRCIGRVMARVEHELTQACTQMSGDATRYRYLKSRYILINTGKIHLNEGVDVEFILKMNDI